MARLIECDACGTKFEVTRGYSTVTGVEAYGIVRAASRTEALADTKDICADCLKKGKLRIQYVPNEVEDESIISTITHPISTDPPLPSVTTTASDTIPETPTPAQYIADEPDMIRAMAEDMERRALVDAGFLKPDEVADKKAYDKARGAAPDTPTEPPDQRVKRLREALEMTQGELAKAAGLSCAAIENIENGQYEFLAACTGAVDLAKALSITVDELLAGRRP